ncbi:MAG TPA: WhiB family transcriptional regulator [Acidimicrobiales bacterium]
MIAASVRAETAWMAQAACKGRTVDMFPSDDASVIVAKRVCAECTVRRQCGDFAVAHNEQHGVWGGMSERERARIGVAGRPGVPHGLYTRYKRGCPPLVDQPVPVVTSRRCAGCGEPLTRSDGGISRWAHASGGFADGQVGADGHIARPEAG